MHAIRVVRYFAPHIVLTLLVLAHDREPMLTFHWTGLGCSSVPCSPSQPLCKKWHHQVQTHLTEQQVPA